MDTEERKKEVSGTKMTNSEVTFRTHQPIFIVRHAETQSNAVNKQGQAAFNRLKASTVDGILADSSLSEAGIKQAAIMGGTVCDLMALWRSEELISPTRLVLECSSMERTIDTMVAFVSQVLARKIFPASALSICVRQDLCEDADITIGAGATNRNVMLNPTGSGVVDVASKRITNLADPSGDTDGATKQYVDAVARALDHKHEVRVCSSVNVDISSALVDAVEIDDVTLATGDTALLINQTDASENGAYVAAPSSYFSHGTNATLCTEHPHIAALHA